MVTGRHVFVKEAPGDLLVAHIHEVAPRASSFTPGIPPQLDDLIARTLAKDPGDRPLSMAAVVAELEELLGTKASEFAHKIPVTSTMIGGVSLRPRVSLPGSLPRMDQSTPLPPSTGSQRFPAPVAGGTRVLSQDRPESSTFRHTASELLSTASRKRAHRKSTWFVVMGVAAAAVAAGIFLTQPHSDKKRGTAEGTAEPSVVTPTSPATGRVEPARRAVEAPEEPVEAPRTARAPIRIESRPADAELWVDGEARPRGRTPLDVALPPGSRPVDAVLKAPGYADHPISIDPARGKPLVVELTKQENQKPSKQTVSKRHSSHESRKQPPDQVPAKPAPAKPDTGYFGVGD
jgi:serine/threonine-protein kinase